MTEGKIMEPLNEHIEASKEEEVCELWGTLVTKSPVRLKIWQILQLFGELNVTQISNLLKESKSTVSRHLNSMEQDKLVKRREIEPSCDGRIAPKLYCINSECQKYKNVMDQAEGDLPKEFSKRIEFIRTEIQTNRSSIAMISGIMELLLPIYDEVENLIKENTPESLQKADEIFMEYIWGDKGANISWFIFRYTTPKMYDLRHKIYDWSYKALKDDSDLEEIEKERLKLKTELKETTIEQDDPSIPKKYGSFGIEMPLRKIFKKNRSDK
jgi:DNA-binding transcriptional ArsR family regulator